MWKKVIPILAIIVGIVILTRSEFLDTILSKFSKSKDTEIVIELKNKNKILEEEKEEIRLRIKFYEQRYILDSLKIDSIDNKLKLTDLKLSKIDSSISKKQIENIKNSPSKKIGDDLIISIDKKLNIK